MVTPRRRPRASCSVTHALGGAARPTRREREHRARRHLTAPPCRTMALQVEPCASPCRRANDLWLRRQWQLQLQIVDPTRATARAQRPRARSRGLADPPSVRLPPPVRRARACRRGDGTPTATRWRLRLPRAPRAQFRSMRSAILPEPHVRRPAFERRGCARRAPASSTTRRADCRPGQRPRRTRRLAAHRRRPTRGTGRLCSAHAFASRTTRLVLLCRRDRSVRRATAPMRTDARRATPGCQDRTAPAPRPRTPTTPPAELNPPLSARSTRSATGPATPSTRLSFAI